MSDTSSKRQRTSTVWNHFIENVIYCGRIIDKILAEYTSTTKLLE